jgi:hypothetical protein
MCKQGVVVWESFVNLKDVSKDLASDMLPTGLLVVHDTGRGRLECQAVRKQMSVWWREEQGW